MKEAQKNKDNKAFLPRVIAITSGKGGVGKSSISVNLGISLAKQGAKVCVLDADTGLANANILLGLTPQYSLEHVLYGAKSIEDVMLDGPHGMKLIPGANGISECVSLHPRQQLRLTRELARVENDFDFLLIDTAAGISSTTLDFVSAAQHALIVITPEPTSLTDAFSLIKLLKRRPSKLHYHIMVNMCSGARQAKDIYHRFHSAVEKYIGIESHYLGFVLSDESMRAAVVLQNPVAMFPDDDPSCSSFLRLANTLDNATKALASHRSFSAYWHRQFKRQREGAEDVPDETDSAPLDRTTDSPLLESSEVKDLEDIQSQVLLLIEQGKIDTEHLRKFFQDLMNTFIKRHNESPVDMMAVLEFLVQSPEVNDPLLRRISDRVQHWGGVSTRPSVDELMGEMNVVDIGEKSKEVLAYDVKKKAQSVVETRSTYEKNNAEPEIVDMTHTEQISDEIVSAVDHVLESISLSQRIQIQSTIGVHRYDRARFGSQEGLLGELQRRDESSTSLSEILEAWI